MTPLVNKIEKAAVEFAEKRTPISLPVARRVLAAVGRSQISRMAAALSYRTVFGLIPVLAIGVAVLGGFASDQEVQDRVTDVLRFSGLDEIVVAPGEAEAAAAQQRLDDWLQGLVMKVRDVSFVAIGLTGLLFLVYASLSFMVEIERSANTIYRAPAGRSWVRRIMQYWTTLTLGSLFLIGSFYVGRQFTDSLEAFVDDRQRQQQIEQETTEQETAEQVAGDQAEEGAPKQVSDAEAGEAGNGAGEPEQTPPPEPLLQAAEQAEKQAAGADGEAGGEETAEAQAPAEQAGSTRAEERQQEKAESLAAAIAGVIVSLAISFLLLLFLYMTIPNARVALHSAAIGAAFAAVLWEAGKWAFTFFVVESAAQKLYGAIALVPLFLLWVYITWLILLFGLQISYLLQHFRAFSLPDDEPRGPVLVDPLALVRVAVFVAQRFGDGKTASVSNVATAVGTDDRTSIAMLERLQEAGLLHSVPVGDDREEFTLARPAQQIETRELLELAARMSGSGRAELENERLAKLRRAQLEAVEGVTLADLMASAPTRPPESGAGEAAAQAEDRRGAPAPT